jgi:hypothetical protein
MSRYLHVNYAQLQYWAHPLRTALTAKPSLHQRDQKWQSSTLSDLAFSITTRIGAIQELVRLTNGALDTLGAELRQASTLDDLVAGGYAYSFYEDGAVRQSLVLLTMFAAEGESLFENLAEFYRRFLNHYFGDKIDHQTSETHIIAYSNSPTWRGQLSQLRNTTRHRFAPWLAFEDMGQGAQPRWEPLLVHDWRPERLSHNTSTAFAHLRAINTGLAQAAQGTLRDLVNRVNAAP